MSSYNEEILKRLDKIILEGKELPLEHYSNDDLQLRGKYVRWKANALSLFRELFTSDSDYYIKLANSFEKKDPPAEKIYALSLLEGAKEYFIERNNKTVQAFSPKIVPLPIEQGTIINAIELTKRVVLEYYNKITENVDPSLVAPIFIEMHHVIDPLENAQKYIKEKVANSFFIFENELEYQTIFNVILSSLYLYRLEMEKVRSKSNVRGYDGTIGKLDELLKKSDVIQRKDLYLHYTDLKLVQKSKVTKIFISYQQDFVDIACKIQDTLLKNSELQRDDVFVAHRDIVLSDEWRRKMIEQLDASSHLLALCTDSYQSSAFGNQEVGYAIAKHIKIVPIFWQGTERNKFGFLEGFQSSTEFANNENIEEISKKFIKTFGINEVRKS